MNTDDDGADEWAETFARKTIGEIAPLKSANKTGQSPADAARLIVTHADTLRLLQSVRRLNALLIMQLKPLHLRPETWEVLEALWEGPLSQTEIADAVGGLKGSVSRQVLDLKQQGLVSSEARMDDRRAQSVSLTHHGRQTLGQARQRLSSALSPLYKHLCSAERVVAARLCHQFLRLTDSHKSGL